MRYPEFLKEKGTVGFVAPSFGCAGEPYRTAFENAINKWKEMGYSVDLGPNCFEASGTGISNTTEKCAQELTGYYLSHKNDVLISCGGGELMCEILEHVDFDAIKQGAPKWFMGYSDNTNMTFLLATICDTASIYGPCGCVFGMEPWHVSVRDAVELITGKKCLMESYEKWEKEKLKDEEHPLLPYNCTEDLALKVYIPQIEKPDAGGIKTEENSLADASGREELWDGDIPMEESRSGVMVGRLIGGCMDCLVNLTGTKFDKVKEFTDKYKEDGFIWFLEACDLNVFGIRRAMWQMEQAGWFRYVKGFLFGRPLCHGQEMMGLDQYEAVLPTARRHKVPVVMDVDLGHLPPMMPLVTGSMAKVTAKEGKLEVRMEYR